MMLPSCEYYLPTGIWQEIIRFLIHPVYYLVNLRKHIPSRPIMGEIPISNTELSLNYNQTNCWVFLSQPPFIYYPGEYPTYQPRLSYNKYYNNWWFSSKVFYCHHSHHSRWKLSRPYQLTNLLISASLT